MQAAVSIPPHLSLVVKEPIVEAEFVEQTPPPDLTDPLMRYSRREAARMFNPPVSARTVANYHRIACIYIPQYLEDFTTFDEKAKPVRNKRTALLRKHIEVLKQIRSLYTKRWHKEQVVEYIASKEFLAKISEILGE